MRDILSLTGGQPLAGQIRSQRICHSLAVFLPLELFWVYICYFSCCRHNNPLPTTTFIKKQTNHSHCNYL
ncbi:hypothetical protein E4659_16210 [Dickeya dianthicola]|uniref:Uncharacterized protein n=1 Tax=Dickeya dianthicola TaxID=204039 RepID=A0AAX1C8I6_9GAMM|nr:hypothetical protein [Dickeya dianthicola]MZG34949.1 hypothetical protein [Dickeya dianthicola]MZG42115.1 hypothetical protein [Dickeya dianthicola]MZH97786.1 hypothetical protein [Dickeya dianthicola]MZI90298.1 hypothetical protein [Dickeya dianthicola]